MIELAQIQRKVASLHQDFVSANKLCKSEKRNLKDAKQLLEDYKEAQNIAQQIAQTIQQKAHKQIAGVVTICLQTIFGPSYAFKIRFDRKRGRTEASLLLLKDGHEIEDPMDEDSGGVTDVAGFALRLACLILTKPALRRIMILDEPFRFVSVGYRDNIRQLIKELSQKFSVQFIIVTHMPELKMGKVIKL